MGNVSWPGLESTTDELNVLHTEKTTISGWSLANEGEIYSGRNRTLRNFSLNLIPNNTYKAVYTTISGKTIEENLVPIPSNFDDIAYEVLVLYSDELESELLWDKVHFEKENHSLMIPGGLMWITPGLLSIDDETIVDIVIYGEGKDGEFTHEVIKSNTIDKNNLPNSLQKFLPLEVVEKEGFIIPDGFEHDTLLYQSYQCSLGMNYGQEYIIESIQADGTVTSSDAVCEPFEFEDEYGNTVITPAIYVNILGGKIPIIMENTKVWYDSTLPPTNDNYDESKVHWESNPNYITMSIIFSKQYTGAEQIVIKGMSNKGKPLTTLIPTTKPCCEINITGKAQSLYGLTQTIQELNNPVGRNYAGGSGEIFNDYNDNIATYSFSHAEGSGTSAIASGAHAEGHGTKISENDSTTTESLLADYFLNQGKYQIAGGDYSHVEGSRNTALGDNAHVGGTNSCNYIHNGFIHGEGLIAGKPIENENYPTSESYFDDNSQAVFGKYNVQYGSDDTYEVKGSIFIVGNGSKNEARSNAFRITTDGNVMGTKAFQAEGADYAEYYEWSDGNTLNDDRVGRFVTFEDGNKIRLAHSEDDYILGVVSADPSIVGNGYTDQWKGLYLTDVYGRRIVEEITVPEEDILDEEGNVIETIPEYKKYQYKVNPDYDSSKRYIGRNERKEWSTIGTHGQLVVIDDGSCLVNSYCQVSDNGTATAAANKTDYRVVERLDDTHIRIVIK